MLQDLDVEELALGGLAARVAHHAGGAAHEGDRPVACPLQVYEQHHGDEVADVQGIRRRVEADIAGGLLLGELLLEAWHGVMQQAAPLQFRDEIHGCKGTCPWSVQRPHKMGTKVSKAWTGTPSAGRSDPEGCLPEGGRRASSAGKVRSPGAWLANCATDHPAFDAAFAGHIPGELMALGRVVTQFHHVAQDGQGRFVARCCEGAKRRLHGTRVGIVAVDDDRVAAGVDRFAALADGLEGRSAAQMSVSLTPK